MEPKEKVLKVMKEKATALRAGDIAEAAQLDKKVVEKAMKELAAGDQIYSPKRCFWQAK